MPPTRAALDVRVRSCWSAGHFTKATNQSTSRPTSGTSISRAQGPLNPARSRMRQVGTMSNAIKGVIISKTMNQCVALNVPNVDLKRLKNLADAGDLSWASRHWRAGSR